MSKLLNIAFEEDETSAGGLGDPDGKPNELEKANNMVQNEDSTEPGNVVKIANYKEELAALKEQQGTQDETTDEASDTTALLRGMPNQPITRESNGFIR